jgi:hypothetical protein
VTFALSNLVGVKAGLSAPLEEGTGAPCLLKLMPADLFGSRLSPRRLIAHHSKPNCQIKSRLLHINHTSKSALFWADSLTSVVALRRR